MIDISGEPPKEGPLCLDEDLLILKATSHAALLSLEEALTILQNYREASQGPLLNSAGISVASLQSSSPATTTSHISKSMFHLQPSPKKAAVSAVKSASAKVNLVAPLPLLASLHPPNLTISIGPASQALPAVGL